MGDSISQQTYEETNSNCYGRLLGFFLTFLFAVYLYSGCQKRQDIDVTQERMEQFVGVTISELIDSIGAEPETFYTSDEEGRLMMCLLGYPSVERSVLIIVRQPTKVADCIGCQLPLVQIIYEVIDTIEVSDMTRDPFRGP